MIRRFLIPLLLFSPVMAGCAGPEKLAEKSGDKLAEGRLWEAWVLATRALDKAPGNSSARAAAQDAAAALSEDWQRRILGLCAVDSMAAAEEVLEFVTFRADAARYTTVPVAAEWPGQERELREGAARLHYEQGSEDLAAHRPKSAFHHFLEVERFVDNYRDAAMQATRAREEGTTRLAVVPLRVMGGDPNLGRNVAASWRGDLVEQFPPTAGSFTRILPSEAVERGRRAGAGRIGRESAVHLGREAGADRIVWGTLGTPEATTGFHVFSERVVRRVTEKDASDRSVTRWKPVQIEVISRTRTVLVPVEYEIISTRDGSTLARESDVRRLEARVVWTAYVPEGAPGEYALCSDEDRAGDPERVKRLESRWRETVGESTTLAQVIEARVAGPRRTSQNEVVARFMAGTAFVFLKDLPSTEELAFGAAAGGWRAIHRDLARLDGVDDVDLGVAVAGSNE